MKKLIPATALTCAITLAVLSAEVRLRDGTETKLTQVESKDGMVLLRQGNAFGKVPEAWLAQGRVDVLGIDEGLKRAALQISNKDPEGAYSTLKPIVEAAPSHREARRLLALALRQRGRYEAALFLLNGLIQEIKAEDFTAPFALLVERAEVAVLAGDRKEARMPLSALKINSEGREIERKLSRQLDGGTVVVTPVPLPEEMTPEGLAKIRAIFDPERGGDHYANRIASRIESYLNASTFGVTAGNAFVREIRVSTKAHSDAREDYAKGGSEARFALLVAEATVSVALDQERWLGMQDWQKRYEVEAAARILRDAYGNAQVHVHIVGQKGDEVRNRLSLARSTTLQRSTLPQISLFTEAKDDGTRFREIADDHENYRRNRGR